MRKDVSALSVVFLPGEFHYSYAYVDLDPPTHAGVLGDETFSPTPITGHSANTTPADSHFTQIFLECLPGVSLYDRKTERSGDSRQRKEREIISNEANKERIGKRTE